MAIETPASGTSIGFEMCGSLRNNTYIKTENVEAASVNSSAQKKVVKICYPMGETEENVHETVADAGKSYMSQIMESPSSVLKTNNSGL